MFNSQSFKLLDDMQENIAVFRKYTLKCLGVMGRDVNCHAYTQHTHTYTHRQNHLFTKTCMYTNVCV